MNVESWCLSEASSKQYWDRAQRKHNPDFNKSSVTKEEPPSRVDFKVSPELEKLAKRKHFKEKCKLEEYAGVFFSFWRGNLLTPTLGQTLNSLTSKHACG